MSIFDRQKKPIEFDKEPIKPFGADMDFRELNAGGGSKLFKVNSEGLFMGADNYTDAPFKVSFSGAISAGTTTLTGTLTVSGGAIQTGASGERIVMASNTLKSYDTSGVLRAQLGPVGYRFFAADATTVGSAYGTMVGATPTLNFLIGAHGFTLDATGDLAGVSGVAGNWIPNAAGTLNLGDATNYWNDVSYKTLTDRGCLGSCDDGVELQDGRIVSDTEAIKAIKKRDDNKKTVYGMTMLDYKTFPKMSYKPAQKKGETEGVEMTSMFSVMLGAIRELTNRIEQLEKKIT